MVRLPIFKVGQKVIGVGSDNNGSLSFAEGREHTWEVVA